MLDLTQKPNPKYFWQRGINFFIVTLLVMIAPIFLGIASVQKSIWLQLAFVLIMVTFYVGIGLYAYHLLKATTPQPIFHKPNIRDWRHIWLIIGSFIVMIVLEVIIGTLRLNLTGTQTTENQIAIEQLTAHLNITMIATIIYGVFMAPIVEEIIFRGLVVNYFFRNSWWWSSIILSGVLFAFPHMGMVPTNLSDALSYLIYTVMGMTMAFVYKKTGHLQDSIAIHFVNNAVTMLPLLIVAINKSM